MLVFSDIHLGTFGNHAKKMLGYLKSIKPKMVLLNGDIIDIWQLNKSYWPKHHIKLVKHLFGCIDNSFIIFNYTNFKLSLVYLNSLNRIKNDNLLKFENKEGNILQFNENYNVEMPCDKQNEEDSFMNTQLYDTILHNFNLCTANENYIQLRESTLDMSAGARV